MRVALTATYTAILLLLCHVSGLPNEDFVEEPEVIDTKSVVNEESESEEYPESIIVGIKGGKKASIQNYPYTCAVIVGTRHEGAAAIIDKKWVLTTGSNLEDSQPEGVLVRCGSNSAITEGQAIWAEEIFTHPDYKSHGYTNDISLIKLNKNLTFDKSVQPISIFNKNIPNGKKADLAGFGTLDKISLERPLQTLHDGWLRSASFNTLTYSNCRKYYKGEKSFTNRCFCTKVSKKTAPSDFDHGNPLVLQKRLIGLFSGSTEYANPKFPAIYTDVTKFQSWINETIEEN